MAGNGAYADGIQSEQYAENVIDAFVNGEKPRQWAAGCLLFWTRCESLRGNNSERLRLIESVVSRCGGALGSELIREVRSRMSRESTW